VSITGIGLIGTTTLLTTIGDINDFPTESKLFAYFGLVPTVSNSNQTMHSGRITKHGSKIGRTVLVQCGLSAQKYNPYLKSFYNQIKTRGGAGKARIAVARKLLSIVYRTLKNNWVFEDFQNFILAGGIDPLKKKHEGKGRN
jgi:transposase